VEEIGAWGIGLANKMAMIRAIDGLKNRPEVVLIDGPIGVRHPVAQRTIVDGDATCCSIAAASIVAKVARDEVMCHLDGLYPGYGFASHKGYATREHLESLARQGPCQAHRRSWLAVQRHAAESEALRTLAAAAPEAVDAAR
jgi:ribonuclease HII